MNFEDHIGFTGTSRAALTPPQFDMLAYYLNVRSGWLHHGDCINADESAHIIAQHASLKIAIHPPINPFKRAYCECAEIVHPEKEYIARNHDIVDASAELFACPIGMTEELRSGTWATVRYGQRTGKMVTIIYPDGSVAFAP